MGPEGRAVLARMRAQVARETGADPVRDEAVMARLEAAAERAAREIAAHGRTVVSLPALVQTGSGAYHLTMGLAADDLREEGTS